MAYFTAFEDEAPAPGTIMCPNIDKDVEQVNISLFCDTQAWLRKHGKTCRPKLTDKEKRQLKTCFRLMDSDGSGSIDADELQDAFELLGLKMKRGDIQALLDEVDRDGSGSCEYPEFVEIMTISLARVRAEQEAKGVKQAGVSFDLMATAYRRKRLMDGLMSGSRDMHNQILSMAVDTAQPEQQPTVKPSRPAALWSASNLPKLLAPGVGARGDGGPAGAAQGRPFGEEERAMLRALLPDRVRRNVEVGELAALGRARRRSDDVIRGVASAADPALRSDPLPPLRYRISTLKQRLISSSKRRPPARALSCISSGDQLRPAGGPRVEAPLRSQSAQLAVVSRPTAGGSGRAGAGGAGNVALRRRDEVFVSGRACGPA